MEPTILTLHLNNLKEQYELNKVAKQTSGAVLYRQGKAVILATVAIDETPVSEDFLPMTVQYVEKYYAAAKIPGGFIKRETKPSDFETLTSRIIDRSLRPLFPAGFEYPVMITIMILSSDNEVDLQVASLHAASAALFLSDTPVTQSIAAVRVGKIDGALVVNPSLSQQAQSTLDLLVVGSGEDIVMIEMRTIAQEIIDDVISTTMSEIPMFLEHHECNELNETGLLEAVVFAKEAILQATTAYTEMFKPYCREPLLLRLRDEKIDTTLYSYIQEYFHDAIENAIRIMAKSERNTALAKVHEAIMAVKTKEKETIDSALLKSVLERYKRSVVRALILDQEIRADGRKLDEIRPISIETNILPSVHGSCLFTRGETQALVTTTLGNDKDAQMYELLTEKSSLSESFMVHYNFPGFCVGETKPIFAPGRRELGHGNLAKRALEPTIDIRHDGTIRLVSEILESNGSSSMATVCGGSIALRAAQVETQKLVAGIAMGLISDGERYAVLSDIMGLEDHDGDMDFKIAGTRDGITAMQMDIKLGGLNLEILKKTLDQAKAGRVHILDKMEIAIENMKPSDALPSVEEFIIDPSRIVDIIGKAGATIREIIERFDVTIDLDRDIGGVKVKGGDEAKVAAAKEHIETLASKPIKKQMQYELDHTYTGKIKKVTPFGIFVEMPDGFDALLHISKISKQRIDTLQGLYNEGENIDIVVIEQKGKKVELATPDYLK